MMRLFFLLALIFLAVRAEAATTIYVDPICSNGTKTYTPVSRSCVGGSDIVYQTITAGKNAMVSGDTLMIRGGTYAESISPAASLSGTSYAIATTFQAYQTEIVTIRGFGIQASAGEEFKYFIFKGDAIAKNFVVDCQYNGASGCVGFGGQGAGASVHHIKIDGVDIKNSPDGTQAGALFVIGGNSGIGDNIWVTNSKVHDMIGCAWAGPEGNNNAHAFYVQTSNNLIEYTEIYNVAGMGIHQYNESPTPTMSGNIYRRNYIHHTGLNRSTVGTPTRCADQVEDAILLGGGSTASHDSQAYYNLLANNQQGIESTTANNVIYNNTIYRSDGQGVGSGVCCNPAIFVWGSGTGTIVRNNILYQNTDNNITDYGGGHIAPGGNTNNFSSNPLFVDAAVPNCTGTDCAGFHLQQSSTAVNYGTPTITGSISIPKCGTPPGCYFSTNPDAGAYETGSPSVAITITGPTSNPTYNTGNPTIDLSGTASGATTITWSCPRCVSSGSAGGTLAAWTANGIQLKPGVNIITVTANPGAVVDSITVTYAPSFPGNTLAGAWGFEGNANDSSGNANNGTLTGGATITTQGKFRQGLAVSGANQYVLVPNAGSLAYTRSFTLSAWVNPTVANNIGYSSAIEKGWIALYAQSQDCGSSTASAWVYVNGAFFGSGDGYNACYSTPLPTGQWSHLAATFDGTSLKLYVHGVLRTTTVVSPAPAYIEPTTDSLYIATSQYGEALNGFVDETRTYNFAIGAGNPANFGAACQYANYTTAVQGNPALATVVDGANCAVIPGAPPLDIKFPASATGLKASAASSDLKFGVAVP